MQDSGNKYSYYYLHKFAVNYSKAIRRLSTFFCMTLMKSLFSGVLPQGSNTRLRNQNRPSSRHKCNTDQRSNLIRPLSLFLKYRIHSTPTARRYFHAPSFPCFGKKIGFKCNDFQSLSSLKIPKGWITGAVLTPCLLLFDLVIRGHQTSLTQSCWWPRKTVVVIVYWRVYLSVSLVTQTDHGAETSWSFPCGCLWTFGIPGIFLSRSIWTQIEGR